MIGGSAVLFLSTPAHLDRPSSDDSPDRSSGTESESLATLLRSYLVYSACSIPVLIDSAPAIISTAQSVPIIRTIAEAIIRHTFFDQFVGGDTAVDTFPILDQLQKQGTGTLLAYSVEVQKDENSGTTAKAASGSHLPSHKEHVAELFRCIDAAAEFEAQNAARGLPRGKIWSAVKLTALVPEATSLERLSTYLCQTRQLRYIRDVPYPHSPSSKDLDVLTARTVPSPLTAEDVKDLKELYEDLRSLCQVAQKKDVTLIFDAEHTWYAPAIDAIVLGLTREFNRPTSPSSTPLIYGTYQSYLRRGLPHLQTCLADAKRDGYMLGVKLVRGAYHSLEAEVYAEQVANGAVPNKQTGPPIWTTKLDTDETYNKSAAFLVTSLKNDRLKGGISVLGVMFGTHNTTSAQLIIDLLVQHGLATPSPNVGSTPTKYKLNDGLASRFTIAQLYGMRDDLTSTLLHTLIASAPVTMKYVPYGSLQDVIPYLARRAIENKSVLGGEGGAIAERRIVGAKLKRKVFGTWFSG